MLSCPLGEWLVASAYTSPATSTLGVATWMGPTPGSRAMWGGDPIQFSLSDESDMAFYDFFFFLAMTHFLELKFFFLLQVSRFYLTRSYM